MAVEPNRHFDPRPQFTPYFTPSSLRDRSAPPVIHNIRNRAIPQPPGFEADKPYGYISSNRPGVRITVRRGTGIQNPTRPLTFAETIRRAAAAVGGYFRSVGPLPSDYERERYF